MAARWSQPAPHPLDCAAAIATADVDQRSPPWPTRERWARPTVDRSTVTDIEEGRHPLVERSLGRGHFVAQ